MRWEEALEIKQNWTAEQARNDLERLIITGERPADKVVGLACQALDNQIPKHIENQRKRLIELINDKLCATTTEIEVIAEHLLANGVIVLPYALGEKEI